MTRLKWGQVGDSRFENGVDRGVFYKPVNGQYQGGVPWNGLTAVTKSPSGAEASPQYADNRVYVNLVSAEQFAATIEALTYPEEFEECDGSYAPTSGVVIGQQVRQTFGFCYRTNVGTDANPEAGHKIHLVYGCLAAPSEQANSTVNDSPEATPFSWELSSTPVEVGTHNGKELRPTSTISVDSTRVSAALFAALEDMVYGTAGADPYLPLPGEVIALFEGSSVEVTAGTPTYDSATDTITIPNTTGVVYYVDGEVVPAGPLVITEDTVVTARPADGYYFSENSDNDWYFDFS